MSRFTIEGPAVVVPARIAAALERELNLHEFRQRVRGRDRDVDAVMIEWRSVAAQWVDEVREQRAFRNAGSLGDHPRKMQDNWDANEVAARSNCTARAVRLAATDGRLIGVKAGRRWRFDPIDVAEWAATRRSTR